MEITEINMISDFQAGMKCLQNPSLISRFLSFQVYTFWKWGALIFAIFATFSSLIRKIKLFLIRFHTVKQSSIKNEEIIDFSDDDEDEDDDISISLASSDDEDEQSARQNRQTTSSRGQHRVDEDFRVKGLSTGRNCGGAWSDFASGKSVVKLWDSLSLSLDFDEDLFNYGSESVVSTWDYDRDLKRCDFPDGIWNIPAASAATVVLTAEGNRNGDGVVLGGYDSRMRRRIPALYAEWKLPAAVEKASAGGGVGKVYVRNGVSGTLTVGDVRNVRRPLESVMESDGETWWDADAVIVEDEV